MTDYIDLATAVQTRFGADYLKQLTNHDDASATTVDTGVLYAACQDVIGCFKMESGFDFDATNATHVYVCIDGVVARLEMFRGRDAGLLKTRWNSFLGALSSMRKKLALLPSSTSMYNTSQESTYVRPDMDRTRPAFQKNSGSQDIQEVSS